jgi:N-acetylglucosaminyldiphosphoundecaprenol N-acetyl-beta-D-mannosaminyltransferase
MSGSDPGSSRRAGCPRVNILGVGLSAVNRAQAVELFFDALRKRQRGYVTVTGTHGVIEAQDDRQVRSILNNAYLCVPDGMPMVWIGKLRNYRQMSRVYGPDLMLDVCKASARQDIRHFFYGGANGCAEELKARLTVRFPGLNVVGTYEPPFRPLNVAEADALRGQVEAARPDIFWVGISTPKQERFMAEYLPRLPVTLMVGVGAAFDFHAGRQRPTPLWAQQSGLEWLYRLCHSPRRLLRRNLNNFRLIPLFCCQWLGLRKYELE